MDFGVADCEAGELVREPVAVDVFELVEGRGSGFDDDRGERQFGESLHLKRERFIGERRGKVLKGLPLDGGEDRAVWGLAWVGGRVRAGHFLPWRLA